MKHLPNFFISSLFVCVLGVAALVKAAPAVELIVHAGVPNSNISLAQARSIFGARISRWEDGSAIRVFVLPEESVSHKDFAKQLLDLYPYQLRNAWNRIIFTGIGQAPIMVTSEAEMLKHVSETPGAIGYIGKVQNNDKVRALPIR